MVVYSAQNSHFYGFNERWLVGNTLNFGEVDSRTRICGILFGQRVRSNRKFFGAFVCLLGLVLLGN